MIEAADDDVGGACSAASAAGANDAITAVQAAARSSRHGTPRSKAEAFDGFLIFTVLSSLRVRAACRGFLDIANEGRAAGCHPRDQGG